MSRPTNFSKAILARIEALQEPGVPRAPTIRACPAQAHKRPENRYGCARCVDDRCARMTARGLDEDGVPLRPRDRPRCGAKTRRGTACRGRVIPGKRRCRFHGGASTGPKTAEGRARIAAAQRRRWRRWRACRVDH